MWVHERLRETDPGLRERRAQLKQRIAGSISSGEASRVAEELVTIPTVVHVVHRTEEENVSDEQVASQLEVLNRDFRAQNEDAKNVPEVWGGLVADAKIQFELVTEDPQGNLAEGLLGYAQFPGGPPESDGVVIRHSAFGTVGSAAEPFNLGRTCTHEVGHYLNLFHIWGDSDDCSGSDEVSDTPSAQAPNYGKPEFPHVSCNNAPNGDMYTNYMDYSDDAAMFMFTPGQVTRMNATLAAERVALAKPV